MPQNFPKKRKKQDWKKQVLAHSPYLSALLPEDTGEPPACAFEKTLLLPKEAADVMQALRRLKRSAAFVIARADLAGAWDDLEVMRRLSRFADFSVGVCLKHLLIEAQGEKKIRLKNKKNPEEGCGVAVIALGKWGAHELNYSSDIDLMVVFDPLKAPVADKEEAQAFFTRLTRRLAEMLEKPTADGYVFRADLRLRPDPGAMPLAVSIAAAETYYGSLGQNWERAAMIKARPVAGDISVGRDFMGIMNAWIWRKNLDFAAIQDIHSIKRQINARHNSPASSFSSPRGGEGEFLNFNVKLGHGGIREIEFYAQTQQLIFGGRDLSLRAPDTLSALDALAAAGHVEAGTCKNLSAAYLFLRRVEHRLQMREDRQTHSLPETEEGFADLAAFLEYDGPRGLLADLKKHTGHVRKLYAALFTESPSLAGPGNLVFTGVEDDAETLSTLRQMGFLTPSTVTAAVRGWHHGRYRAVRSERARQILTELIPHLLTVIGKTAQPDDALIRFDRFLSHLPAGVPIFSMFAHNPSLMELVAEIMGASPPLAEDLSAHPQVLEGALSKDFFHALPDLSGLKAELEPLLSVARDYQDVLDVARRFARENRFRAGVHILKNLSSDEVCCGCFSDIAEAVLACLVPKVEEEFARTHGRFTTGGYVILAMGSFAARRMSRDSDLDIIALYDAPAGEEESDGEKPLPPSLYYIRLTQRLIAALSAPTAEGILYDPDLRLRPDGEKGSLAPSLGGFLDYERDKAWAWEHMSLIRSRVVVATPSVRKRIEAERLDILARPRDPAALRKEMLDMRGKMEKQFGSGDPWALKHARGGFTDIMFAAHYLALTSGRRDVFSPSVRTCLERLCAAKLLASGDFRILARAYDLVLSTTGFLRLCFPPPFRPGEAPDSLQNALVRRVTGKKGTFRDFSAEVEKTCRESYQVFRKVMEG